MQRSLLLASALAAVLLGVLAPGAAALPTVLRETATVTAYTNKAFVCGEGYSQTFPGPKGFNQTVLAPKIGDPIVDKSGKILGTVSSVVGSSDSDGFLSLRIDALAVSCAAGQSGTSLGTAKGIEARVSYTVRVSKRTLQFCGDIPWLGTRTDIEANAYVSSCRKARLVAKGWLKRFVCTKKRCPSITRTGGYKCRIRFTRTQAHVRCTRGRAVVAWSWRD